MFQNIKAYIFTHSWLVVCFNLSLMQPVQWIKYEFQWIEIVGNLKSFNASNLTGCKEEHLRAVA